MIIQCCVCQKQRDGEKWVARQQAADPKNTSHGYCPACADEAFQEIQRNIARKKGHRFATAGV